jgi:hypothetical protein
VRRLDRNRVNRLDGLDWNRLDRDRLVRNRLDRDRLGWDRLDRDRLDGLGRCRVVEHRLRARLADLLDGVGLGHRFSSLRPLN